MRVRRLGWIAGVLAAAACSDGLRIGGPVHREPVDPEDPGEYGGWGGTDWSDGCGGPFDSCDLDGDGHCAPSCGGDDCNDRDPLRYPGAPELCSGGVDEDCDGWIDEDCGCKPGDLRRCYPRGNDDWTRNTGACRDGWQRCNGSGIGWGPCTDAVLPVEDVVCDGTDADCDLEVDEGLTNACATCGQVQEICFNGLDDDCDGRIDPPDLCDLRCDDLDPDVDLPRLACCLLPPGSDLSGTPCERRDCDGRSDQPCYSGPPQTLGKGLCHGGVASCAGEPGERTWTECAGEQLPESEVCGDGIDNDCDGHVDEDDGETGHACTHCHPSPSAVELCDDGEDNNCDGFVEEACLATADEQACYPGAPGTRGVGACQDGVQLREDQYWGLCQGAVVNTNETCGDGIDADCDGFGGPGVQEDAGCCVPLGPEVCNGSDDDCDGLVDEGVLQACGLCTGACYDDELLGPDACAAGTCDGVALVNGGALLPARGAPRSVFTRVVDAHHLTARWDRVARTFTGAGSVDVSVRVGANLRDLLAASPCAAGSGPEVPLAACGAARLAEVTVVLTGSSDAGPLVSSVRALWTRP